MDEKTISKKEKRQIQRYCLYPKIIVTAFIFSIVPLGVQLLLGMIGDLIFHHEGFYRADAIGLRFCIAYAIIFIYCMLSMAFGMRGKRWKALQNRLNVRQTTTDYTGEISERAARQAVGKRLQKSRNGDTRHIGRTMEITEDAIGLVTAGSLITEAMENAKAMAKAYRVPIPNIKKPLIAFAVLPILVLIGAYIPEYVQSAEQRQEESVVAAEQIEIVKNALLPVCEYVSADDPMESPKDSHYDVIGYLREKKYGENSGPQESYVYISFDKTGVLTDISYVEYIDINASLEENLNQTERDFEILQASLENLNVSALDPDLLKPHKLSDQFKEDFLNGSLYESFSFFERDASIRAYYSFETKSEEDFNEYTDPKVWLSFDVEYTDSNF